MRRMLFKNKKIETIEIVNDGYIPPMRTLFDGTNDEVLLGFSRILNDIKEILTDEEYPDVLIAPEKVNENATKKELGELYLREKVGERIYALLKVFMVKKPNNIYHILDTLFCASEGTYRNRKFKDTLRDLKLLSLDNIKDFFSFFSVANSLK